MKLALRISDSMLSASLRSGPSNRSSPIIRATLAKSGSITLPTHNYRDVVAPALHRVPHFRLILCPIVNPRDPGFMPADMIENRFDYVGQYPKPVSHQCCSSPPNIVQAPIRETRSIV